MGSALGPLLRGRPRQVECFRDRGVVPRLHLVTPGVSGPRGDVLAILWDDGSQKRSSDLSSGCCSALHGLGELEHVALLLGACLFILDGGHSNT